MTTAFDLETVRRHVAEARDRLAEQAVRVDMMVKDGLDTPQAKRLLAVMQDIVATMEQRCQEIEFDVRLRTLISGGGKLT